MSRIVLAPHVRRLDRNDATTIASASTMFEIEGDSVPLVRALLDALRVPRDREAPLHDFDAGDVAAALAFLEERGLVVDAPPETRASAALAKGAHVFGDGALARAIAGVLQAPLAPLPTSAAHIEAGALVVSVSNEIVDSRALDVDVACRAAGAIHVPVVKTGGAAIIGPLTAPFVSGPCARCALLRLLGISGYYQFQLWRESIDRPGTVGDDDEALAHIAAPVVAAFIRSVGDDGGFGGKQHALVRVDPSGASDAHRVRRHSHCAACATPPATIASAGAQRAIEEQWRAHLADDVEQLPPTQPQVDDFSDRVTGLIQLAEEWRMRGDYFRRFPVLWGGVNLAREHEWVTTELQGINGTGPTVDHRRLVCVSEGAERYGQYAHRPALTHASWRDVKDLAIDPRDLVLYADYAKVPRKPFDENRKVWWSWGYGLASRQAKLLPSELVAVAVFDETYPERLVDQMLTSGAASHTSWHRALLNGMRELVERDAHMIAWYKKLPLARVDVGVTGDAYSDDLLAFLRASNVELHVLDLRVDFPIPTYLMVARLRETRGCWEAGGAVFVAVADLDPIAALSRGLCETALHYETLCLTPHPRKEWRNNPYDPDDESQGWRAWWPTYMFYLNPANVARAEFLWSRDETVPLSSIASFATGSATNDVANFVAMFADRKLEPYAFDLVGEELADLNFRVAKVVVPGLVDLTPGMQSRRLRSPRLDAIAKKLGRGLPPGETNRDPHPNA